MPAGFLPLALEDDMSFRTCTKCGKWISMLGMTDESGKARSYNRCPAVGGLCTCVDDQGWLAPGYPDCFKAIQPGGCHSTSLSMAPGVHPNIFAEVFAFKCGGADPYERLQVVMQELYQARAALELAHRFMTGFEDDELQEEPVAPMLDQIREAIKVADARINIGQGGDVR